MDIDFLAYVEQTLDNYKSRIEALEKAVTQIPAIDYEVDTSRPSVVKVAPAAVNNEMVVPPVG